MDEMDDREDGRRLGTAGVDAASSLLEFDMNDESRDCRVSHRWSGKDTTTIEDLNQQSKDDDNLVARGRKDMEKSF
jgi:hypothetical protein